MIKNILAFGASNSKQSINKQFAHFTARQIPNSNINLLDLNDYEMPIFSLEREEVDGIHELALQFKEQIKSADGIIVSFAEHNGAYSAAFKNIFDWVSRIDANLWEGKPLFLLASSPGGRGGQTVLEIAYNKMKRMTDVVAQFSLPSFYDNFNTEEGVLDEELKTKYNAALNEFISKI